MDPKYNIGQKVILKPVNYQPQPPRDSTIEPYIGQVGNVVDYYWISPRTGEVFFVYKVRVGKGRAEIALHEDEIEAYRA